MNPTKNDFYLAVTLGEKEPDLWEKEPVSGEIEPVSGELELAAAEFEPRLWDTY